MRMKLTLLLVTVALSVGANFAKASFFQRDHLFGLRPFQIGYEYLLSQTVFEGFPYTASIAFYELSSFQGEKGVWMHSTHDGYQVVCSRSKKNLWQWARLDELGENNAMELSQKISEVRDAKLWDRRERLLPKNLGERVVKVWYGVLFNVELGSKPSGLDGTTLVFRAQTDDDRRASWDAWSPTPGSLAARLGDVGTALIHFCESGNTTVLEKTLLDIEKETKR